MFGKKRPFEKFSHGASPKSKKRKGKSEKEGRAFAPELKERSEKKVCVNFRRT